jgi:hypothetical protein
MDGFDRFYSAVRQAGAEEASRSALQIRLGRVLSARPLRVEVAGTAQEATRFYLPRRLAESELSVGRTVLLLTADDQTFYLMDEVVRGA